MVNLLKVLQLYIGCTGRIFHISFLTIILVTVLLDNPIVSVDTYLINVTIPFTQFLPGNISNQFNILNLNNNIYKIIIMNLKHDSFTWTFFK